MNILTLLKFITLAFYDIQFVLFTVFFSVNESTF
jgi:hypothetical protein